MYVLKLLILSFVDPLLGLKIVANPFEVWFPKTEGDNPVISLDLFNFESRLDSLISIFVGEGYLVLEGGKLDLWDLQLCNESIVSRQSWSISYIALNCSITSILFSILLF